jgi:hypothetical protein
MKTFRKLQRHCWMRHLQVTCCRSSRFTCTARGGLAYAYDIPVRRRRIPWFFLCRTLLVSLSCLWWRLVIRRSETSLGLWVTLHVQCLLLRAHGVWAVIAPPDAAWTSLGHGACDWRCPCSEQTYGVSLACDAHVCVFSYSFYSRVKLWK